MALIHLGQTSCCGSVTCLHQMIMCFWQKVERDRATQMVRCMIFIVKRIHTVVNYIWRKSMFVLEEANSPLGSGPRCSADSAQYGMTRWIVRS